MLVKLLDCSRSGEVFREGDDHALQLGFELLAQSSVLLNLVEQGLFVRSQMCYEVGFPLEDQVDFDTVKMTIDTGVDEGYHFIDSHRRVLLLLQ